MKQYLTRRRGIAAAAVLAVGIAVPVTVAQVSGSSADARPRTAAPVAADAAAAARTAFYAYHGKTAAYHLAAYKKLKGAGYRPISLNVSNRANPAYAAVWVKRSGPAFTEVVGKNAAGFQSSFNALRKKGYQPTVVTATGEGKTALYAGIFEKKGGKFSAHANLTAAGLAKYNKYAAQHGFIPVSVDAYGSAKSPRYVAVWNANPRHVKWNVSVARSFAAHDKLFQAQMKRGWRPSFVAVGTGLTYTAIWRNDRIGAWYEYTGMSSSGYQQRFDYFKARGFHPIQVAAGGAGANARYAAIWAR
ncbi:hypothetical protein [Actinomadura macrotermitis]|uniref:Uncharacterized protein n=1 Tax=Actinomadura macrotermitis TaxID=2585200 RepID=A0A7K0BUG5_9ACTN|nr:hypothetical protein [Actinomadura macrotermitis]MQY04676.1 hypothetical protein [Actinomadura macrotermitis]